MSNPSYRYERKFVIPGRERQWVEAAITMHPAGFTPLYPPRQVNNLYFDSPSYDNYFDNVNGARHREKVRVRWYGELFATIVAPHLEFKRKDDQLGWKHTYPLAPFTLDRHFSIVAWEHCRDNSSLPAAVVARLNGLSPTLVNSYQRKYFLSRDRRYRLTLDYDLSYLAVAERYNSFPRRRSHALHSIVELKYAAADHHQAQRVSALFPFRLAKNSKYSEGLDWLAI